MNTKPDYMSSEEYQNRLQKIEDLQNLNIDPFPHRFVPTHTAQDLHTNFDKADMGDSKSAMEEKTEYIGGIAGRLVLFRAMGKNAFAHIQDETGRMQLMFNRDKSVVTGYDPSSIEGEALSHIKLIEKKIDLGDIIGVKGHLFRTNKGELTILVKEVTILCKALLPLAEKHAGLHEKEIRYRKRWLDLISNEEVRHCFQLRSRIMKLIRNYMEKELFIEVETPILQSIYGGAEARPFVTKLNALDQEMFLRISLEIPLKKLVIGGMGRIYELGKVFRNEGIDRSHNPEFTLLEAYAPYWDYNDMMAFIENLFETLAMQIYGKPTLTITNPETKETVELNLKAPWKRFTIKESIKHFADKDVDKMSDEEIRTILKNSGHIDLKKLPTLSRGLLIGALFEVEVEPKLIQPHHITDYPIETCPLCKLHRDPERKKEGLIERFESFILGGEICNSYTELNDPLLQRELLEQQALRREQGDEEASPLDEEFLESICQGLPPTGGIGFGVDRLIMLFVNAHTIRDVLYFPWMKPQ